MEKNWVKFTYLRILSGDNISPNEISIGYWKPSKNSRCLYVDHITEEHIKTFNIVKLTPLQEFINTGANIDDLEK